MSTGAWLLLWSSDPIVNCVVNKPVRVNNRNTRQKLGRKSV